MKKNEMLTKIVGKMTVEKEWLAKKLKGLDLPDKKQLIEPKPGKISLSQQCELLGLNRSSFYYQKREKVKKNNIKPQITEIFEEIPIYGAKKYTSNYLKTALMSARIQLQVIGKNLVLRLF